MLIVNKFEDGYLNGDLGILMGFYKYYFVVKLDRGGVVYVELYMWENFEYDVDFELVLLSKKVVGIFM